MSEELVNALAELKGDESLEIVRSRLEAGESSGKSAILVSAR